MELSLPSIDELAMLLWLDSVPRVGPAAARQLLRHFGTPREAFEATSYSEVPGLRKQVSLELERAPKALDHVRRASERVLAQASDRGISIITSLMPAYPPQLLDPTSYGPAVLYVIGDSTCLSLSGGALVGTRAPSAEACERTRTAAATLVHGGYAIFSGMALGIDAQGHQGAMDTGGNTVAVLGCGVDRVYPPEHRGLYERIRASGAIVSEYAPGIAPSPAHLRRRNRLIVGLSRFVIVAECPVDSGAMIAARAALQQQRPLLVLNLETPNHSRERGGSELLAQTGLAAKWDAVHVDDVGAYVAAYIRPKLAEATLDRALGRTPPKRQKAGDTDALESPGVAPNAVATQNVAPEQSAADAAGIGDPLTLPQNPPDHGSPSLTLPPTPAAETPDAPTPNGGRGDNEGGREHSEPSPLQSAFFKGQRLRHPKFGTGVVNRVEYDGGGYIEVRFDTGGTRKLAFEYAHLLGPVTD